MDTNKRKLKLHEKTPQGIYKTGLQEQQLAQIMNTTSDGMLIVDPHSNRWQANHNFYKLWNLQQPGEYEHYSLYGILTVVARYITNLSWWTRRLKNLYDPSASFQEVLFLKDGRMLNVTSKPFPLGRKKQGRLWCVTELPQLLSKEAFEEKLNHLMNPFLLFEPEQGTIIHASGKFSALLSDAPLNLAGKNVYTLKHETGNNFLQLLADTLANHKEQCREGEEFHFQEVLSVSGAGPEMHHFRIHLLHADNLIANFPVAVCQVQDVTEDLQYIQSLSSQKQSIKTTLDEMGDAAIACDREGHITGMNACAEHLTGWPAEEAKGKPLEKVYKIYNQENGAPIMDLHERISHRTESNHDYFLLQSRQTGEFLITESTGMINGVDGTQEGFILVFRDVTKTEQTRQKLEKSELRYRKLFEQAPIGIIQFDANLKIEQVNEKLAALIGYKVSALMNQHIDAIEELTPLKAMMQEALQGKTLGKELKHVTEPHNHEIVIHASVSPLTYNAATSHYAGGIAIIQDITRQRIYEELLRRNRQKAIHSEAMKSGFLKHISHDLRTPLNWIMGYAGLLKEETLSGQSEEYIKAIEHSGHQLLRMLDNVLAYSEMETGEKKVQKSRVLLNAFLRDTIEEIRNICCEEYDKAQFEFVHQDTADTYQVVFDETLVRQVLKQLLLNAVQYSKNRHPVQIGYDLIGNTRYSILLLYVKDYGEGIPEHMQKAVFRQFSRGRQVMTDSMGTGLGLAIAKECASMLDGKLWAETAAGQGAIFYLLIPVELKRSIKDIHLDMEIFSKRRLLVHSDNSKSFRFLQMVASDFQLMLQYEPVIEALPEKIPDFQPDVLLVNYVQLDDRLRKFLQMAQNIEKCPLILVLLSFGDEEAVREIRDAGVEHVYVKPVPIREVLQKVLLQMVKA